VRKVPLLKGLSDNDLLRVAERMPERVYADGAALIRYGERGDEMYLIRYGKVRVAGLVDSFSFGDLTRGSGKPAVVFFGN
jgi:CRP-like cAMP-binding protein